MKSQAPGNLFARCLQSMDQARIKRCACLIPEALSIYERIEQAHFHSQYQIGSKAAATLNTAPHRSRPANVKSAVCQLPVVAASGAAGASRRTPAVSAKYTTAVTMKPTTK